MTDSDDYKRGLLAGRREVMIALRREIAREFKLGRDDDSVGQLKLFGELLEVPTVTIKRAFAAVDK